MGVATWSRNSADMILKQRQHHGDRGRLIRVYCKIFKLDLVTALCLFVLHCTSRARKDSSDWVGNGAFYEGPAGPNDPMRIIAYIMPPPFDAKPTKLLLLRYLCHCHMCFSKNWGIQTVLSVLLWALKHGLCSRTQGLARHSDIYLTM